VRASAAKCASRQKPLTTRRPIFFAAAQPVDASSKNALAYDGWSSGPIIYSYALGNPVSLIDPDGLDATVCLYPASGPWGHVGIGINSSSTAGLYPRDGASGNPVTGTPGIVKPDSGKAEQCKTIQTTAEQDKKMADFLARATVNPGTYKFTGNNCTNLVRLTLQQGGISTSGQPGPRPYFEALPGRP
jgi:hypothetical protein